MRAAHDLTLMLRSDGRLDVAVDGGTRFQLPAVPGRLLQLLAENGGHDVGDGLVGFKSNGYLSARLGEFIRLRRDAAVSEPTLSFVRLLARLRRRLALLTPEGKRLIQTRRGMGFRAAVSCNEPRCPLMSRRQDDPMDGRSAGNTAAGASLSGNEQRGAAGSGVHTGGAHESSHPVGRRRSERRVAPVARGRGHRRLRDYDRRTPWGLSVYAEGNQIQFFAVPLSQGAFFLSCAVWFIIDARALRAARRTGDAGLAARQPYQLIHVTREPLGVVPSTTGSSRCGPSAGGEDRARSCLDDLSQHLHARAVRRTAERCRRLLRCSCRSASCRRRSSATRRPSPRRYAEEGSTLDCSASKASRCCGSTNAPSRYCIGTYAVTQ